MNQSEKIPVKFEFSVLHIAPCGMNCGVCLAYLRDRNRCDGCRTKSLVKLNHCEICSILHCDLLAGTESKFCYDCVKYPCRKIRLIDKRYRTRYGVSLMGNLEKIKSTGIDSFLNDESLKWRCRVCGGKICIHRGYCLNCARKAKPGSG